MPVNVYKVTSSVQFCFNIHGALPRNIKHTQGAWPEDRPAAVRLGGGLIMADGETTSVGA